MDSNGSIIAGPAQPHAAHEQPVLPMIELQTPAHAVVIPVMRTVAADLAARADFELDSIDDLRMAVDDACAMLVGIAATSATLSCRFTVWPERIEMVADVNVDDGADPLPTGSFRWRVLECLTEQVKTRVLPGQPGRMRITLSQHARTTLPWD
jgi:serine/threonine-protein kinase RsbW